MGRDEAAVWILVLFVVGNFVGGFFAGRLARSRSERWVFVIALPAAGVFVLLALTVFDVWRYGRYVAFASGMFAAIAGRWVESRSASRRATNAGTQPPE